MASADVHLLHHSGCRPGCPSRMAGEPLVMIVPSGPRTGRSAAGTASVRDVGLRGTSTSEATAAVLEEERGLAPAAVAAGRAADPARSRGDLRDVGERIGAGRRPVLVRARVTIEIHNDGNVADLERAVALRAAKMAAADRAGAALAAPGGATVPWRDASPTGCTLCCVRRAGGATDRAPWAACVAPRDGCATRCNGPRRERPRVRAP
jgi:hypothetical protein